MNNILVFLICLGVVYGFSKSSKPSKTFVYNGVDTFINKQITQGSSTTLNGVKGGWRADSMLSLPPIIYADTTAANFSKSASYSGSLILTGSAGNYTMWFRTLNPPVWNKLATGSIPSTFNPIQGYGMLLTGTYPNITFTVDTTSGYLATWALLKKKIDSLAAISTGTGTVISISTTSGILGGTITTSGTLSLGDITPTSVNSSGVITATSTSTNSPSIVALANGSNNAGYIQFGTNPLFNIKSGSDYNGFLINAGGNVSTFSSVSNLFTTGNISTGALTATTISGSLVSALTFGYGLTSTASSYNNSTPLTEKVDTTLVSTKANVTASLLGKLNISDTASMLSNRLKISDTATMLSNRLKISDTATMLSNRLNISDTLTMLSPYDRKTYATYFPNAQFLTGTETLSGGGEASMIMLDANTVGQWYRLAGDSVIKFRTANNATLTNWGSSTTCSIPNGLFPEVFQIGSTYYMFLYRTFTGNMYLYSSTDKVNWTAMNGGNAVITHSNTTSDWYHTIYNVGVCVVGTTLHILVEGAASTGAYSSNAWMGYATADISSPIFTLPSTPQIPNAGNPQLTYVPERNSIVALYGEENYPSNYGVTQTWRLRGAIAKIGMDLTAATSWNVSPVVFPNLGAMVADPNLVFTPGKTYPSFLYYNYAQATGYTTYSTFITSAIDLYNSLPINGTLNQEGVFHKLQVGGINDPRSVLDVRDTVSSYTSNTFPLTANFYAPSAPSNAGNAIGIGKDSVNLITLRWNNATNSGSLWAGNDPNTANNQIGIYATRVGINTATPRNYLEVAGSVRADSTLYAMRMNSGTAGTDSIVVVNSAELKRVSANSYIINGTSTQSAVYNTQNTLSYSASSSQYGGISSLNITSGGGNQTGQLGNSGLIGQFGFTPSSTVTPYANSYFSGVHGDMRKRGLSSVSGNLSGISSEVLFSGSGTIDTVSGFRAIVPLMESGGGGFTGTVTNYAAITINPIRGVTDITTNGRLINSRALWQQGTTDTSLFNGHINIGGTLTIGTGSASNKITVYGDNTAITRIRNNGGASYADAYMESTTTAMVLETDKKITLGPNFTTALELSTAGLLRLNAYGTGTLTTDASGNVTATSDKRKKDFIGNYKIGLKEVLKLQPVLYHWNKESGLSTKETNAYFFAQDVIKIIPEAVFYDKEKDNYTMTDRAILAAYANAFKDMQKEIDELKKEIKSLKHKK